MRALIQRVTEASVEIDGQTVGRIGRGLLILLGVCHTDTAADAQWLADKCANLRIFTDPDGKFNLSALQVGGDVLVISQFTLYGDASRGRRPDFTQAAPPAISEPLYEEFVRAIRQTGLRTETGRFGAIMQVRLVNDGPVTIIAERGGIKKAEGG
jgi:D-tyrosyl-tRNA(Tyr) deacylase